MTAGTVQIGDKSCAVGLLWQKAASVADAKAKSQRRAGSMSVDLVCYRAVKAHGKRITQYGVASSKDGLRPRMPVLAASLADRLGEGTAVGAWPADGGRWVVVAVKDGLVLPEGDILCPDEAAARLRVQDLLDIRSLDAKALGEPDMVLVPACWEIPRSTDNGALAEAIGKIAGCRLGAIGGTRSRVTAGVATAVFVTLVGAVVAAMLWATGLVDFSAPPPAILPVRLTRTEEPPPPPPWWNTVRPAALGQLCRDALNSLPVLPGFRFSRLTCSSGGIVVDYARNPYASVLALDMVQVPGRVSLPDKDQARIDRPARLETEGRQGETPSSADRVVRALHGVSQFFELRSDLSEATPPAPPPGVDAPPPPPYRTFRWAISGKAADPRLLLPHIDIATLVVEAIQYDDTGWKLQGVLYARR